MSQFGKFGPLVGAIDEGTSSARFLLFQCNSTEIVASYQKSVTNIFPQEGYYEQDPLEILQVVEECIEKTVEQLIELGGSSNDIVAIGITNQRETTIVWDPDTGAPIYNAIIWSDIRTIPTVDQLLEKVPNQTKNKNYLKPLCGLPLSTYFSAVKLRWLLDNSQEIKMLVKNGKKFMFGTVDTWLIWNLCGQHVTDVTNASRTMLMNLETLEWDPILLDFFDVPENVILPTIKTSSEIYGHMKRGVLAGVPISGCLGDQQAALVGQNCLQMGQAKCTYGTGCFLLYCTGQSKVDSSYGLLTTVGYQLEGQPAYYALEGSVAVAGSCLTWLRDNMEIIKDYSEIDELVKSVKLSNGDVYFVPAFSGLFAPHWDSEARGIICGITEETKKGHIVVAALESVCFQAKDILDVMNKECGVPLSQLKVDGGMTNNNLLMQWQADFTGVEVVKPAMVETTALGAAMAAGHAVGMWNFGAKLSVNSRKFKPSIGDDEREMRYQKWKMAIERSLGWEQN